MKVGILGGGQLARMLAEAAHHIGVETLCVDTKDKCSASYVTQVASITLDDIDALLDYFKNVECISYESENIPVSTIEQLERDFSVFPGLLPLAYSQDRLLEKNHLNHIGIATTDYQNIETWPDLLNFRDKHQYPFIIKTRTNGYDGKGQYLCQNDVDLKHAWRNLAKQKIIAENFIHFDYEVSIIAGRSKSGEIIFYPLSRNTHQDGILRQSMAPFINPAIESQAQIYARALLDSFNYVGILAIEFFCKNDCLIANEIAPRVHNSGHWTINGAETSQFENHIRAICGMPFGSSKAKGYSSMINCIENYPAQLDKLQELQNVFYYDYNKSPASKRKIGHININTAERPELQNIIQHVEECI